jgi:hypothetical protein
MWGLQIIMPTIMGLGNLVPMANGLFRFFGVAALVLASCSSNDSGGTVPDGGGATKYDASTLPSCASLCPAVLAPHCSKGPVDQADCVSGCEFIRMSPCADTYIALADCGGTQPVYGCDSAGRTIIVGCESASAALYVCTGT